MGMESAPLEDANKRFERRRGGHDGARGAGGGSSFAGVSLGKDDKPNLSGPMWTANNP